MRRRIALLMGVMSLVVVMMLIGASVASAAVQLSWAGPSNYGGVFVGDDTKSQTYILANSGDRASAILTISLTGSPAFTKTADTCSGTRLRPRRPTCSVTVQFAPTAPGNATTTLQAISPKGKVRASFGLAGTGVLGFYRVQWAPSSYDFGSSSGAVLFRLLNVGNRPVWLAPGGQLPNSDPFLLVNPGQYQQCLLAHQYGVFGATPLAVGASCDILVQHIAHPCPTVSFVLWTYRYYTNAARTTTDTAPAIATGIGMPCPV